MPENRVPLDARGQSTINKWNTGPSTNGRSSAFGALCLGSNPSGPAKFCAVDRGTTLWVAMRADTNAPFAHSKPEPYTVYERAHMATLATPAEKKGQQVPEEKRAQIAPARGRKIQDLQRDRER